MATTSDGEVGTAIHLTNVASKGRRGGRVIPLNRELRAALLSLSQMPSRGRPSAFVITTERTTRTSPQAIVNLFSRWYADLGFSGCSSNSGRRTFITNAARKISTVGGSLRDIQALAGHSNLSDYAALHRVARRGAAQDRGAGLSPRSLSEGAMTKPSDETNDDVVRLEFDHCEAAISRLGHDLRRRLACLPRTRRRARTEEQGERGSGRCVDRKEWPARLGRLAAASQTPRRPTTTSIWRPPARKVFKLFSP